MANTHTNMETSQTPGPSTTNTPITDPFADMKSYMTSQFAALHSDMASVRGDVAGSVEKISRQVNQNKNDIEALRAEIGKQVEEKVGIAIAREMKKSVSTPPPTAGTNEDEDYWRCRRSIRCWPIKGPNSDLWGLTGDFFKDILGIPSTCLGQDSVESIRRLSTRRSTGRPARIHNEVLVTFVDVATRDTVFSYASNLSKFRSAQDPPGIRLEYPNRLTATFRTLEKYGILMKAKFGPQFKRSIKYDDSNMSLLIDVLIPGDDVWTKVSLELAKEVVEKSNARESAKTRDRLDSLSNHDSEQATPPQLHASPTLRESDTLRQHRGSEPPARWGTR